MQDSQQGLGNGLDLVGGAAVAGEVRSKCADPNGQPEGRKKGLGGAGRPAGPRESSLSAQV